MLEFRNHINEVLRYYADNGVTWQISGWYKPGLRANDEQVREPKFHVTCVTPNRVLEDAPLFNIQVQDNGRQILRQPYKGHATNASQRHSSNANNQIKQFQHVSLFSSMSKHQHCNIRPPRLRKDSINHDKGHQHVRQTSNVANSSVKRQAQTAYLHHHRDI